MEISKCTIEEEIILVLQILILLKLLNLQYLEGEYHYECVILLKTKERGY